MEAMRLLLTLLALFPLGTRANEKLTLMHAGKNRTYFVHHPPRWKKEGSAPAILALHGGGGTGEQFEKSCPLAEASDAAGFVVAYPEGTDKRWADGRPERVNQADDLGFLKAVREALIHDHGVDPTRVFAAGISNGGAMSFRLACEAADKFRAIAPVVMNLGEVLSTTCKPSRPISVLQIVGDQDKLVPFRGGQITGPLGFKKMGKVLSAQDTLSFWGKTNGCEGEPKSESWDRDPKDATRVTHLTYSKCKNAVTVEQFLIAGGGHTWPSGSQYLPKFLVGRVSQELEASREIVRFFLAK